jgi:hypothetical protein
MCSILKMQTGRNHKSEANTGSPTNHWNRPPGASIFESGSAFECRSLARVVRHIALVAAQF